MMSPATPESDNEAECFLRPYVSETLSLICDIPTFEPIFSTFYVGYSDVNVDETAGLTEHESILLSPSLPCHIGENGDTAAVRAEKLFWEVISRLGLKAEVDSFWPPLQQDADTDVDL